MNNKIWDKIKNNEILSRLNEILKDEESYIVGGFIRDLLLEKNTNDIDIVVKKGHSKQTAKQVADFFQTKFITLDENFGIYRVVFKDKKEFIDISNMIGDSIEEDLSSRDITINAIAYNFNKKKIVDPFCGQGDLRKGIIKTLKEENLENDALRILRIFRFQAVTGFDIDEVLRKIVPNHVHLLDNIAKERINYELMKLFEGEYADKAIIAMDETSVLTKLFPHIENIKQIPPNTHHHLDLFNHSLETLRNVQRICKEDDKLLEYMKRQSFGVISRIGYLKFASFFHDWGKPFCFTIEEETKRHRFINHDKIGAKDISSTLKFYKFSKKQIEYITNLIAYHIYPSVLLNDEILTKTKEKFFTNMEENVIDLIVLAKADRLSARGVAITDDIVNKNINGLNKLQQEFESFKSRIKDLPKLLSGNDIMEILQIPQSKKIGEVLKQLREEQINGTVSTKEEAVDFVFNLKE